MDPIFPVIYNQMNFFDRFFHDCRGDFFGEIALLKDAPRTADVAAESFSDLLILERSDFDKLLNANPELKQTIEKVAESRIRN